MRVSMALKRTQGNCNAFEVDHVAVFRALEGEGDAFGRRCLAEKIGDSRLAG